MGTAAAVVRGDFSRVDTRPTAGLRGHCREVVDCGFWDSPAVDHSAANIASINGSAAPFDFVRTAHSTRRRPDGAIDRSARGRLTTNSVL